MRQLALGRAAALVDTLPYRDTIQSDIPAQAGQYTGA